MSYIGKYRRTSRAELMKSGASDQDNNIGPLKVKTKSVAPTPTSKKQIIVKSRFCDVRITIEMIQDIDVQDVRYQHPRAEESCSNYHGTYHQCGMPLKTKLRC